MDITEVRPIDRDEMVGLATTEYERLLALFRALEPADWDRPTVCDGWTVKDMVAHLLGAAEANASLVENARQVVRGRGRVRDDGRPLVDGINDVQVDDRRHLSPAELVERLAAVAPRAVRGRRRTPPPLRRVPVPGPLGDPITLGFLVDVAYTRDQWMHRVDVSRATDRELVLTGAHDGRIVADIVRDWSAAHGEAFELELTGPAGGHYHQGTGGPELTVDAVGFCLAVSGRSEAAGLLGVPVVF
jgi:uncharacterized protein (TIGR03083 family)